MIPIMGLPLATMPTLTVNSSRPARNSRVPSSGSTRMKPAGSAEGLVCASSETTGTPGSRRDSPSRMTALAASSAMLTGERSAFVLHSTLDRSIATMAAAAREYDVGERIELLVGCES
jgi:hypothetical protein